MSSVKVIKTCDFPKDLIAKVFKALNGNKVQLKEGNSLEGIVIETMTEPKKLTYPEGWYYSDGCIRNNLTSTTGNFEEIPLIRPSGGSWKIIAKYNTFKKK